MPTKQRSRVLGSRKTSAVLQKLNGGAYVQKVAPSTAMYWSGKNESINTVKGNDGRFRPVEHSLTEITYPGYGGDLLCTANNGPSNLYTRSGSFDRGYASKYALFESAVTNGTIGSLNSVDWNALGAQALSAMLPSLNEGMSLATFLVELKDFKHLGESIIARATKLKWGQRAYLNKEIFSRATGLRKKNTVVRNASSAYLSWMFAWKPLYQDVVKAVQNILAWKTRVDEYVRRAGSIQQRYYGINLTSPVISTNRVITSGFYHSGMYNSVYPGLNFIIEEYDAKPVRYSATMRYRYTMPAELIKAANGLDGLLDVLGVNPTIGTLWNAIPFSFIVDWVVNVGSYLERLKVDNIDLRSRTEILDFCHSIKVKRKYQLAFQSTHQATAGVVTPVGAYVVYARGVHAYYRRLTAIPNIYGALTTSGLSGTEVLLSGALIGSKYKGRVKN